MSGLFHIDELGAHAGVTRVSQDGGWSVPATLTRSGIFTYIENGKMLRVLRAEGDVFDPASVASLAHAPVTVYHPKELLVTPTNYTKVSVGACGEVRRQGRYLAGRLIIGDGVTGAAIDRKELCEVSLGYRADYAKNADGSYESGTYEGEQYDRRQINIRYNHVSLGPRGWGRQGADVGIRLDGVEDANGYLRGMDNVSVTFNDDAAATVAASAPATIVVDMSQFVAKSEHDKVCAERDVLKSQVTELTKTNTNLKNDAAPAALDALAEARSALKTDAKMLGGKDYEPKGSTLEIMTSALTASDPSLKLDSKSLDYVQAAFDFAVKARKAVTQSHQAAADITRAPIVTDAKPDKVAEAEARMKTQNALLYVAAGTKPAACAA